MRLMDFLNDVLVTKLNFEHALTRIKIYVDNEIAREIRDFDKLDYEVVSEKPTLETAVEGVRYMVKHTTDDRYEEYILVDGVIYDIGSTGEIDLSGYVTLEKFNSRADIKSIGQGLSLDILTGELSSTLDFTSLQAQVNSKISDVNSRMAKAEADVEEAREKYIADIAQLKETTEEDIAGFKQDVLDDLDLFKETSTNAFAEWFADKRNLLNDDNAGEIMNRIDDNYLIDFKRHFDLFDSTTTVETTDGGKNVTIVTADARQEITITNNDDSSKTIVEVVTPTFGIYKYTKTTVVAQDPNNTNIRHVTNTVVQSAK